MKKEEVKKMLTAEYHELVNLVEEFEFNKENVTTKGEKNECQLEINSLERRISEVLIDIAQVNRELNKESGEKND